MIATLAHLPGEWIEARYEIQSVLGSGAFGTVYQCLDREIDVVVAVKELHVLDDPETNVNEREDALRQFRREAVHLSSLRHPHIVSGHYQPHSGTWLVCPVCGRTFKGARLCPEHQAAPVVLQQRNYLVMEYLAGPDLARAAKNAGGAMKIEDAVRAATQIAGALQLIHARGWLHRDIKPENIRLRAESGPGCDEAVLLDFGIASETGEEGSFSTRVVRQTGGGGTLGYAPDSPSERRFPDARSDIHALGMTLYHLVSGCDPTEADQLLQMRRKTPRDFNRAVPPALNDIIIQAIQPDPAQRFESAAEFAHALGALLETQTATPQKVAPIETTPAPIVPKLAFASGEAATSVQELATLIDRHPREARDQLYSGEMPRWLETIGRDDLAKRAREICRSYPQQREQGLEALAQATGLLEPPTLRVHPTHLNFGEIEPGDSKTLQIELRNVGRGHLFGLMKTSHRNLQGPRSFDGNTLALPVTINTKRLAPGAHGGDLVIDSSAGELRLPFSVEVKSPPLLAPFLTVVLWAMVGMLGAMQLRAAPFTIAPNTAFWDWFNAGSQLPFYPTAPLFGLVLWSVLMVFVVGEATRQKSCGFFVSFGAFVSLLAFLAGLIGNELVVAGDLVLQPLLEPLVHRWAAGGWMFVGALVGAIYGTLRRWPDLFSARLLQIVFGWLLTICILFGVLIAALIASPMYK